MLFIFKGYLWLCLWDRFSFIVITVKVKKDSRAPGSLHRTPEPRLGNWDQCVATLKTRL